MLRHVGGRSDAAGVQGHVVLLDAGGGQGAQGGVVLRQADGAHHRGQFRAFRRPQQAVVQAHGGVGFERTADRADLHGHLDLADQIASLVHMPARQRAVAAIARGVGVGRRFDGAEVVAGGDGHGIDAVHDALVVGGRAVRIDQRQIVRQHDAVAHLGAGEALHGQILRRYGHLGANQRAIGEVGEDAQEDLAAGDGFHEARHAFAHAVDDVRAHGVAGVHQQVQHHHVAQGPFRVAALRRTVAEDLDAASAAASGDHLRMQAVGEVEDFLLAPEQRPPRPLGIGHVDDLHLADEHRIGDLGAIAAGKPRRARRAGQAGDDGRLLDAQGHHVVAPVDEEVQADAERQAEDADHVLDHLVRDLALQRMLAGTQRLQVVVRDQPAFVQRGQPILHRHLEEAGNARTSAGASFVGRCGHRAHRAKTPC